MVGITTAVKYEKRLPIEYATEVLGPKFPADEFGRSSQVCVLRVTNRIPPHNPIPLASMGSAGDLKVKPRKEDLAQHLPRAAEYGRELGRFASERRDLGIIHVTGGCPGLPYIINKAAKEENPEIYSVAIAPKLHGDDLVMVQEGLVPRFCDLYDLIVCSGQRFNKRGTDV